MNKAQRTVLLLAALVIVAMCAYPPVRSQYGGIRYIGVWQLQWISYDIQFSRILAQTAIIATLATLLTLAFKTPPSQD